AEPAPSAKEKVAEQKHGVPAPAPPLARQVAPAVVASDSANVSTPDSANNAISELADGGDVLHLIFEGASWTEVKDGRGKLLLSRINPRGTEQMLRGKPPFSLAIGNAAEVKLVYNNKPVELTPYTSAHGGTARLSLK
ncbi:MAG: DUF4115 domain-containing protein, partial [Pseudomonadota bacterium]|nr:DUF4115 domain-containing protein [Pseudomonadota bacterium]